MGPLRAGIDQSPSTTDDALLNTSLIVVDFGTANDLEASTPISCGLGMAFVKDPSRPNQNKVSNTACAIVSSSFISETLDLHGTLSAMERFD